MSYEAFLELLSKFALYAWLIAAVGSFIVQRYIKSPGWTFVMIGALFAAGRQAWYFTPFYSAGKNSDEVFNGYMMRFVWGEMGAIFIAIGMLMLIAHYYTVNSKLEASLK